MIWAQIEVGNQEFGPRWLAAFAPWLYRRVHDEYPISTVNLLSHARVAFKYPAGPGE